ncbi:carboxymethylproline synthase [Anaerobacterium chartisolvens]|uniref:Carboxymethylproline synthase n=1 Tax=Anaerobacterium chartisolvens TaxID=1297424 RepID=A0A369B6S6_9FIRM|nr:enoyl-CoA hydratase/isomerase family protein [Anaerobacterium chartisolvens]RCX16318.1 carboxymethylproline synthase [Anaerobacterium chartisolvens]
MQNAVNSQLVIETIKNGVLTVQFNHAHYNNPFSDALESAVSYSLTKAEENPDVKAVIITGGIDRSFSVGGDFNEVKELKGGKEVEEWIDGVVGLYISSLRLTKPTIAAVDKYAIGIGFQLALTCDWRIATERCQFIMPELKHGIACTLGQYMLEKSLGRAAMMEIIYDSEAISIERCFKYGLINKVTKVEDLLEESQKLAERLANYPEVPFGKTKKVINESYIKGLQDVMENTKAVHRASFGAGHAQKFMKKIVGEK